MAIQFAEVSFDIPADARPHIRTIVKRAKALGLKFHRQSAEMDLCATHANGTPLDFARLAAADDFNLLHDFVGISNHIDRTTGKLTGCFLPRFTARNAT